MTDAVKDIIKKTLLFGIGVGAITKEKADELVNEMKKKGYVDVKEGKKFVNDLLGESLRAQKQVRDLIETQVKAAMKKSFAEGDSLEGVCWEGYEPIGLKELDGRMVPNCVPIQEQSKQAFVIPGPQGGEDENTYISRCISDIIGEYDQEGQAYAICKGKWDEPK